MTALISIQDFSRKFAISRSTVYRLRDKGDISFVHVGKAVRIPAEVVDAWYAGLTASCPNDN